MKRPPPFTGGAWGARVSTPAHSPAPRARSWVVGCWVWNLRNRASSSGLRGGRLPWADLRDVYAAAEGGARGARRKGGAWLGGHRRPLKPCSRRLGEGGALRGSPPSFGRAAPGVPWGGVGHEGCQGTGLEGGDICGTSCLWAGLTRSVVLEEREQVIVAVRGEVRRAQVGQQLIRVGQFWEQLRTEANWPQTRLTPRWLPCPRTPARSRWAVCSAPSRTQAGAGASLCRNRYHTLSESKTEYSACLRWLSCSRNTGSNRTWRGPMCTGRCKRQDPSP